MGAGIHGKHPGFGDFIGVGLPATAAQGLLPWLDNVLANVKESLGDDWDAVWDAAPALRFWIGGGLWGGPHLRGVMIPSRDRVGRRYPLMAVLETDGAAPVTDPAQDFYDRIESVLRGPVDSAQALRDAVNAAIGDPADADAAPAQPATFWAANPAAGAETLLGGLAATDALRAQGLRSYWWVSGDGARASAAIACGGLPDPGGILWLLQGVAAQALAAADDPAAAALSATCGAAPADTADTDAGIGETPAPETMPQGGDADVWRQ